MKPWAYKITPKSCPTLHANPLINTLLHQRGIQNPKQAEEFFHPNPLHLHPPEQLHQLQQAAERLNQAIQKQETIFLYSDYDADGITAMALMINALRNYIKNDRLPNALPYALANRQQHGYGLSTQAVQQAIQQKATLLIALDCGTKDHQAAQLAQQHNIDLIICDHHNPSKELPPCHSLINPYQPNCQYPNKGLSGCALGFKLIQRLCQIRNEPEDISWQQIDLVAISLLADVMPLIQETRQLVQLGMEKLRNQPSIGIQSLLQATNTCIRTERDVTFGIAPHLNATGRIAQPDKAVSLLIAQNLQDAQYHTKEICQLNTRRKYLQAIAQQEALQQQTTLPKNRQSNILLNPNWHIGIIGIIAARCTELTQKPSLICTQQNNLITGSARSIPEIDIHQALSDCKHLLIRFGGHTQAAGCTLLPENMTELSTTLEAAIAKQTQQIPVEPSLEIDLPLALEDISWDLIQLLEQLGPFGHSNPLPLFFDTEIHIKQLKAIGNKQQHLRLSISKAHSSRTYKALGWELGHWYKMLLEHKSSPLQLAYNLQQEKDGESYYLNIKDINFD